MCEVSLKDEGQDRFVAVYDMGTEEMQKVLLPASAVQRAPEAPIYVYAVQGHSNTCREGGANA